MMMIIIIIVIISVVFFIIIIVTTTTIGRLHGLTGSAGGHRSIAPGFKPRPGYIRRVFHLSLRLITFEGRSDHLAYLVHKT